MAERLMSVNELAEFLGLHRATVSRCWHAWGLTGYRIGKFVKFRQREVEAWLSSCKEGGR